MCAINAVVAGIVVWPRPYDIPLAAGKPVLVSPTRAMVAVVAPALFFALLLPLCFQRASTSAKVCRLITSRLRVSRQAVAWVKNVVGQGAE